LEPDPERRDPPRAAAKPPEDLQRLPRADRFPRELDLDDRIQGAEEEIDGHSEEPHADDDERRREEEPEDAEEPRAERRVSNQEEDDRVPEQREYPNEHRADEVHPLRAQEDLAARRAGLDNEGDVPRRSRPAREPPRWPEARRPKRPALGALALEPLARRLLRESEPDAGAGHEDADDEEEQGEEREPRENDEARLRGRIRQR